MSLFYSFGTGMLKGIEEQNERRYKMIEDMVPLMQETYLTAEATKTKAQDNRNTLYKTLGNEKTNALLSLHKREIDASDTPIKTAQELIDGYGGFDSTNFKSIVQSKKDDAPALSGEDKYNASKQFFIDNNIIGPAGFDFMNQETMQANQQPVEGQQVTEQAMIPEGQTMQITQQDPTDQPITTDVSTNIFGVESRPDTFADDVYHGPLFDLWNKSTSAFAGTRDPYDVWLRKERSVPNPNYNPNMPKSSQNQETIKMSNEDIYNSLLTEQDPGRIDIIAGKQQEQEGGSIQYDGTAYLSEIEKLIAEGNMEQADAVFQEAASLGIDLSDELGI